MIRFFYIIGILLKYAGILLLMKLSLFKKQKAVFLKQFFEEAGGSFVKFGQLLALRIDILPKEYSLAMLDLLDNVKPFSYAEVKEVFLQELGALPEKIFYDFQPIPFASGSFGQVHAGKLDEKTIIAVKILRPDIEDNIRTDFFILGSLAFFADTFFPIASLSWREFFQEFKRWTSQELDYHQEAENAEKMRSNITKTDRIYIPKIYSRYSTRRILVQEYIEGVHLSRVLRGIKDGRLTHEALKEMGINLASIPHTITQEIMKQYFFHGFFHADLHPGNIIILPNNTIALIDVGIIGETIPQKQKSFALMIQGVGEYDFKKSAYYFSDVVGEDLKQMIISAFPASIDEKEVEAFMTLLTNHFADKVEVLCNASRKEMLDMKKDYTTLLLQIVQIARNYKIKVPKEMAIFLKTLSTLGVVSKDMDVSYKLGIEIKQFFNEHPIESLPFQEMPYKSVKRISREKALERLNTWLAYLLEFDPEIYKLVEGYITQYNVADK